MLPLPWWKQSNIINLPPGVWEWCHTGGSVLVSLWLRDWAINSSQSQISLGSWESMLLSPCIASIPATMATLLMSPLDDDNGGWGMRLTGIQRTGHPIHWIIKVILCWSHSLWAFTWDTNIFMFFCLFREVYPHTSSPDFLSSVLKSWPFQVPHYLTKPLATAHELV